MTKNTQLHKYLLNTSTISKLASLGSKNNKCMFNYRCYDDKVVYCVCNL